MQATLGLVAGHVGASGIRRAKDAAAVRLQRVVRGRASRKRVHLDDLSSNASNSERSGRPSMTSANGASEVSLADNVAVPTPNAAGGAAPPPPDAPAVFPTLGGQVHGMRCASSC